MHVGQPVQGTTIIISTQVVHTTTKVQSATYQALGNQLHYRRIIEVLK